jgi:hypothetical protein
MNPAEAFATMKERLQPWATVEESGVLFVADNALEYRPGLSVLCRRENTLAVSDS